MLNECGPHQFRCRVLRLADRQTNRRARGRGYAVKQRTQPFKGIGLQTRETRIHSKESNPTKPLEGDLSLSGMTRILVIDSIERPTPD